MDAQTGTYYIFNPETDMAMASGRECYTAPLSVRKFAANLALLPALYAPEGSIILTDYDISPDTPYIDIVRRRNLKVVRLKRGLAPAEIEPWGWNPALRETLHRAGISDRFLPLESQIAQCRRLAHRATAAKVASHFKEPKERDLLPLFCRSLEQAIDQAERRERKVVVKLPWSSSGRGVFISPDNRTLKNLMSRQGGVMIEPLWDNVFDFASEWRCFDGRAEFMGWSVFQNSRAGNYMGNIVATQTCLKDMISAHCNEESLNSAIRTLESSLTKEVASCYNGPLGVDMLCDRTGDINPCVEINLRRTMGHIALQLYRLFKMPKGEPYRFYPGKDLPVCLK